MSVFNSGQPIIIPDPVDVGVQSIVAGSNVTITGTAAIPIINAANQGNSVTYNVGGGFTASPYTITNLDDQDFVTLTAIAHSTSFPVTGAAYQLTFTWEIRDATFGSTPAGNLVVVVIDGPTVTSGTLIGQSACFVNANIPAPPADGPIAGGTISCLFINDNDVDISIGLGNFTGQKLDDGEISITSVSVTFLSANPTVLNDFE